MRYCADCGRPIFDHEWGAMGKPPPPKHGPRGGRTIPGRSDRLCPIRRLSDAELAARDPKPTIPVYVA